MPFSDRPEYRQYRYLIVDDKPFIRTLVNSMLLRAGVRHITQASNGEEAIKMLQRSGGKFNCIISDWNMEPVNGLQLLQKLRTGAISHTASDTCFLLLTGAGDAEIVNTAIQLDVSGYVVKPVSYETFLKSLANALGRKISVKGSKYYEALGSLETPRAMRMEPERTSPWVLWLAKSPQRHVIEARLEAITREAAELAPGLPANGIKLKNKQERPIAEIRVGSILGEDLHGGAGQLLIAAGTVLTEVVLYRLRELSNETGEALSLVVGDPLT